jgi:hypothetical protein
MTDYSQLDFPGQSDENLPSSKNLNIAALSRLFEDTTNSYKFLFFMSLLDILRRRYFDASNPISFEDLIIEMLANAWYPHTFFRLSFGSQDKISKKLDSLDILIEEPILKFADTDKILLRQAIASQDTHDIFSHFRRYVPFRLIVPFVEMDLGDVSRGKGNQLDSAMPGIVDRCFDNRKPLYRFNSTRYRDCYEIVIHPDWIDYLKEHYSIVRGWVAWKWLSYMQKRNPSTPAISSKLFMPQSRESLKKQTDYWKLVLNHVDIQCIYSGETIDPKKFALDHYIPWSFVAHDQLWNLIPTLPKVNSSKSNNIPSQEYFERFVKLQHLGLKITHKNCWNSGRNWKKLVEPFSSDLALSSNSHLLDFHVLKSAYERTLKPLENLALAQGFSGNWRYK